MSLASRIAELFLPSVAADPTNARTEFMLADVFQGDDRNYLEYVRALSARRGSSGYRLASVKEALGVPAVLGAVSLITNTVGSLSLEAFRQGQKLGDTDRPRVIVRPNPFTTPRVFFRDTAFYLATRGEAWWWIAARDPFDGAPLSLYPVPPWEITVAANDRNRLKPKITWNNKEMKNEDMRQITYLPSSDGLRGVGPLQLAGAAVSVSVESQNWAANFFSGSLPSIIGTTEQDMTGEELQELDKQWGEKPPNMPRWLTNGLKLSESPVNPERAQLTESRNHQVGEAARMFSMPGALIEYQMGGSSLTYQNQSDIWNDFQRRCLSPHYLEPVEQEISDLLTRATVARFNVEQLLRADAKSRAEVYSALIPVGVLTVDEARQKEGLQPGAVDFAPVPLATPQATPDRLPINRSALPVRCASCNRMLAEAATPPYRFTCPKCKTVNEDFRTVAESPLDAVDGLKLAIHSLANPPVVNVEAAPAPQVTVEAPAPPNVIVNMQPVLEELQALRADMKPRPVTRIPVRDDKGRIIRVVEEVA